uniref:Metalloendopeptidase n=1 Tax=Pachycerianthus maua TaxID=2736681 RepID=A0A7G7WYT9_9CNID|nr:toxin candidate TRINITY_DN38778_c2_g3_i1 [Pachycerianthus maua]
MARYTLFIFLTFLSTTQISCKPYKSHKKEVFERDMRLTAEQQDALFSSKKNIKRNVILDQYLWPSTTKDGQHIVEVPYQFASNVKSSVKDTFKKVVNAFNRLSCIRLVPRKGDEDCLLIESENTDCDSWVGHVGGEQPVNLGYGCQTVGHGIHEVLHAVGFYHEQSRPDRDDFVKIYWENIQEGFEDEFRKYSSNEGRTGSALRKIPYDTHSIMHYINTAFSKNGGRTIEDIQDPSENVGQLHFFSANDLFKLNTVYDCSEDYRHAKTYKIIVETSNDWWSGTDARVFVEVFKIQSGARTDSGEIELKEGQFESGDVDVEMLLLPDLTPIGEIIVWHSNEGMGASWKLYKVVIEDTKTHQRYTFIYDGWFEGDASENRKILKPN